MQTSKNQIRSTCTGNTTTEKDWIQKSACKLGKKMEYALQSTAGVPMRLLKLLNARAEMIAPALPLAAEIPWAVALNLVGKSSAG